MVTGGGTGRAPKAAIVAIADEEQSLAAVERELRKRYGTDYEVVCARGAAAGRRCLEELLAREVPVAVVVADQWMPEMTGIELLAWVRSVHPRAKRGVLIARGDVSVRPPIARAAALGEIDTWVPKPAPPPDEQFQRVMTELLDEWGRAHGNHFVAVRVVGEQWTPRCHELRDLLGRNGVPFEFCTVDSEAGAAVLQRAGAEPTRLPVVELHTGEVLADPTNERIAEAFGVTSPPEGIADVVVVGAGPAGLAAAVYAASEGLDRRP